MPRPWAKDKLRLPPRLALQCYQLVLMLTVVGILTFSNFGSRFPTLASVSSRALVVSLQLRPHVVLSAAHGSSNARGRPAFGGLTVLTPQPACIQHAGPSLRRCRWPAGRAPQGPLSRGPFCRSLAGLLRSYLQTWGRVLGLDPCRGRGRPLQAGNCSSASWAVAK